MTNAENVANVVPRGVMTPPYMARRDAIAQDLQRERNRQEKIDISQASTLGLVNSVQQSLHDSILFLSEQLNKLQQDIDDHIKGHPQLQADMRLLQSILRWVIKSAVIY